MTKLLSVRVVSFDDMADNYNAIDIRNTLANYVARTTDPTLCKRQLEYATSRVILYFNRLLVFHKVQFSNLNSQEWLKKDDVLDIAHVRPA